MRKIKSFVQILPAGVFVLLILTLSSCSKQEYEGAASSQPVDQKTLLLRRAQNLKLNIKTSDGKTLLRTSADGTISFSSGNMASGGQNFTNGGEGNSFSGGEEGTNYSGSGESGQSFSSPTEGNSFNVSGGVSAGGGNFMIKGKNVKLDYVLCAAGDLFDDVAEYPLDDIQLLVGISGEFKDPENAKLNYLVMAYVIGKDPSGNYKIDLDKFEDEDMKGKFALIAVYDFSKLNQAGGLMNIDDAKIYISTKGTLQAAGGAFLYNNVDFVELLLNGHEGSIVKGSGNLLCN